MNQQNDGQRQSQASGQQSQSQSGGQKSAQSGAPRSDPDGGMHPGEDRDDYGAPANDSGRVGNTQFEQGHERERREPGQVDSGDYGSDTGTPAGYGDRGQGGSAPGQYEQADRNDQQGRDEQQGRNSPDSEHARQAEQSESGKRRLSDDENDPSFGQE